MVEICLQGIYQCSSSKYLAAALLMQSLSTALWKGCLNEEQYVNKVGHGLKYTFQQFLQYSIIHSCDYSDKKEADFLNLFVSQRLVFLTCSFTFPLK